MSLTLESIDARVRALEAKVFPQTSLPFTVGWVAHANAQQINMVKMMGANRARISTYPGGAKKTLESVMGLGVTILPSIKRERNESNGTPAMTLLKTQSEIDAERAKHRADRAFYKSIGINVVELGNEIDNPDYWNGTVEEYVTHYVKHIAPDYRADGFQIIHGGPQVDPKNWKPFVRALASTGQLFPSDRLSQHPYQGTASAHHARRDENLRYAQEGLPGKIDMNRFDITEAGLQRGGSDEARRDELAKMIDGYIAIGFRGAFYPYRIMETARPESKCSPFRIDGSEHPILHPMWKSKLVA